MGTCIDERLCAVDEPLGVARSCAFELLDGCIAARAPSDVDLLSLAVSSISDSQSSVCLG